MQLIDLEGVGEATAEKLKEAGYENAESLEGVESYKLVELGVSQQTIDKLVEQGLVILSTGDGTKNNVSNKEIKIKYERNDKDHVLVIDGEKIRFIGGVATVDEALVDKIIKKGSYSIIPE